MESIKKIISKGKMKKIKNFWLKNKHVRIITFLILNGIGNWCASCFIDSQHFSILFGGALNYVMYLLSEQLKKEGVSKKKK